MSLPALDRAAQHRTDLAFLEAELTRPETLVVPVWRGQTLFDGDRLTLLRLRDAAELLELGGELVWLGRLGEVSCVALEVSALETPADHPALHGRAEAKDLRFVGGTLPRNEAELALFARGILHWHSRQRFCGACGSPTDPREGGHMRRCRDASCAERHFPRTDPAIIVLVRDGDECLLGRQAAWPAGMYSTLAGFVEPGESMEQAVVREVAEETGVRIDDIRYFRSQPWPFPASLMIGFVATAKSRAIALDDELEDARWISKQELRNCRQLGFFVPGAFSLAGQLLASFLDEPR